MTPLLTDCEYGSGNPSEPEEKKLLNDCANPNKGTTDFLGTNLISLVSFIIYMTHHLHRYYLQDNYNKG